LQPADVHCNLSLHLPADLAEECQRQAGWSCQAPGLEADWKGQQVGCVSLPKCKCMPQGVPTRHRGMRLCKCLLMDQDTVARLRGCLLVDQDTVACLRGCLLMDQAGLKEGPWQCFGVASKNRGMRILLL